MGYTPPPNCTKALRQISRHYGPEPPHLLTPAAQDAVRDLQRTVRDLQAALDTARCVLDRFLYEAFVRDSG